LLFHILLKEGRMVSAVSTNDLAKFLEGYKLCAQTEGKSRNTIQIVTNSIRYFEQFLFSEGLSTDVTRITTTEIRAFILFLQRKRCFSNHPYSHPQERELSSHTVNCYLRSIRAFWSWLVDEEIINENPFNKIKLPKPIKKIIPTFSASQLHQLISVIDTSTAKGSRDYSIILTLLDSALRVTELTNIKMDDLMLDDGLLKVLGKGGKERHVPIGTEVQRVLWRYISRYRPQPINLNIDYVFLTRDGNKITRNRIENIMLRYGEKTGISGVRISPHTLRHTAAVNFLRNGGDVFSLQRLLGHTSLEMTRHYCELADIDVKRAHLTASPVDNLNLIQRKRR
jgi:site-specific recombinase XerD